MLHFIHFGIVQNSETPSSENCWSRLLAILPGAGFTPKIWNFGWANPPWKDLAQQTPLGRILLSAPWKDVPNTFLLLSFSHLVVIYFSDWALTYFMNVRGRTYFMSTYMSKKGNYLQSLVKNLFPSDTNSIEMWYFDCVMPWSQLVFSDFLFLFENTLTRQLNLISQSVQLWKG